MILDADEVILQAGHNGGRCQLDYTAQDIDFLEDATRSGSARRAMETFAWRRHHPRLRRDRTRNRRRRLPLDAATTRLAQVGPPHPTRRIPLNEADRAQDPPSGANIDADAGAKSLDETQSRPGWSILPGLLTPRPARHPVRRAPSTTARVPGRRTTIPPTPARGHRPDPAHRRPRRAAPRTGRGTARQVPSVSIARTSTHRLPLPPSPSFSSASTLTLRSPFRFYESELRCCSYSAHSRRRYRTARRFRAAHSRLTISCFAFPLSAPRLCCRVRCFHASLLAPIPLPLRRSVSAPVSPRSSPPLPSFHPSPFPSRRLLVIFPLSPPFLSHLPPLLPLARLLPIFCFPTT